jgi:hypothetical protein
MDKKKIETSKILLLCVLLFCGIAEIVILMGWLIFNIADAGTMAGVFATPAATVIGFYSAKAAIENKIKLKKLGFNVNVDSTSLESTTTETEEEEN